MKRLGFLFCFFVSSLSFGALDGPYDARPIVITVSPTNSNVVHFNPIINFVFESLKPYVAQGKRHFHQAQASFRQVCTLVQSLVWEYRNRFALGSVACAYLGVQGVLVYLSYRLDQKNWWSLWQDEVSFSALCLLDQGQLGDQLVRTIQSVYMCPENPMDLVQKFMQFLADVEQERYYLQTYVRMSRILHVTYLEYISYVSSQCCQEYAQRLERLAYIEHVFSQWVSDYTIGRVIE